jgi:hypothetical protein
MAMKKLTITETRLNHNAVWFKDYMEQQDITLTPADRSNWYNIEGVGVPSEQTGPAEPFEGRVFKGQWSTFLSGDGLSYSVIISYDDEHPVRFYGTDHEAYTQRLQYCADNVITITSQVTDE